MNIKLWGLLAVLLVAMGGVSYMLSHQPSGTYRQALKPPEAMQPQRPATAKLKTATHMPGRVVVLDTTRGRIEFVMFEKDCPKTTERIADLVQSGAYNGVTFPRVEDWVIQTSQAKKHVTPMGIEVANGLLHAKGSVGMARPDNPNMNTSIFYITLEPAPHLDMLYTNFGRVTKGLDVAMKIRTGDRIKSASIRPLTDEDKKLLGDSLQAEAERRTQ